jgi:hypothetical protein
MDSLLFILKLSRLMDDDDDNDDDDSCTPF